VAPGDRIARGPDWRASDIIMTETTPTPADVWQTLASIPDPEFGINIVDLGLIYSVECADGNVTVIMTLTTPTCPSGAWIHDGVQAALRAVPGVKQVEASLVFEPAWSAAMLSANARHQLGWSEDT
jgi:metal-sulfur cluster biosynthetic enzyme